MVKKIMTYNVYRGGEDRIDSITDVILKVNPDILVIQEANGWQDDGRLSKMEHTVGVQPENSVLFESNRRGERRYDLVVLSKFQIESHEAFSDPENVWHAIGHIVVKIPYKLHIIAVHLCPRSEEWRLKEVSVIKNIMQTFPDEPIILLGDFNSLSDIDSYPDNLGVQLLERGISKFGNPPRFDVLKTLRNDGWIDLMGMQGGMPDITVQEKSADPDHLNLRLDYILVNKIFEKKIKKMYVEKGASAQKASDHLPVIAEFDI